MRFLFQFHRFLGLVLPACLTFFLMVIGTLPFPVTQGLNPWLGLLSVVFWAQLQPKAMTWWIALGLGVLQDLWTGMPLPTALFVFPLCVLLLHHWHLNAQYRIWHFINIPVTFGILLFAITVWLRHCLALQTFLSPMPTLWAAVLTLALYPLLHNFLLLFYPMTLQTTPYRSKFFSF